jgi:hypothetical protein
MLHVIKSFFGSKNFKSPSSSVVKEIGEVEKHIEIKKRDN